MKAELVEEDICRTKSSTMIAIVEDVMADDGLGEGGGFLIGGSISFFAEGSHPRACYGQF